MTIRLTELLARVEPQTAQVVAETRQRFNTAIRRHLRDETRLTLTTTLDGTEERESRTVRVSVTAGFPEALRDESFDDNLVQCFVLFRT